MNTKAAHRTTLHPTGIIVITSKKVVPRSCNYEAPEVHLIHLSNLLPLVSSGIHKHKALPGLLRGRHAVPLHSSHLTGANVAPSGANGLVLSGLRAELPRAYGWLIHIHHLPRKPRTYVRMYILHTTRCCVVSRQTSKILGNLWTLGITRDAAC